MQTPICLLDVFGKKEEEKVPVTKKENTAQRFVRKIRKQTPKEASQEQGTQVTAVRG